MIEEIFTEAGVDVNQCHEPPPGVTERVEEWTKLLVRQLIQKVLVLPQRYRDSLDSVFKLINGAITGGPRKPKSSHREMSSRMIEARRRQYRDLRQRIQDEEDAAELRRERARDVTRGILAGQRADQVLPGDIIDQSVLEV